MSIDPSLQRCRYYSAGRCNKGSDCNFSHGSDDSLASDCWGESTSVVEAVNHLATHSRNEHQKLCRYWKAGKCKSGSDCKFSHGAEDSLASDCWGDSTGAVEAVNPPATGSWDERRKTCSYWKAGNRKNGSDCKFSHETEDSLALDCWGSSTSAVNPPNTESRGSPRKTCSYWKAGNCKNGSDCKFSHGTEDSLASDCWGTSTSADNPPATESRGEPRKTCSYWKAGNCRNGSDCKFSHGPEDSVASDCWGASTSAVEVDNPPTIESWGERRKTCSYWKAGKCKNGSDCRFSHGPEDSLASDCWGASTSAVEVDSPPATESWDCWGASTSAVEVDNPPTTEIWECWGASTGAVEVDNPPATETWECWGASTGAVEVDNPPVTESRGERRKTCSYWKAGNCKNGSNCRFSHGTEDSLASDCWGASTSAVEAVNSPATESGGKRQKTCSYWKAGNCRNGSDCKFSHGTEDSVAWDYSGASTNAAEAVNLPITKSWDERRQTCRYWKMGDCKNGADCKFSHGARDSLPSDCWAASTSAVEADNPPTTESWGERRKTCSYWKAGNCKNGSDCKFSHGTEDFVAWDCSGASTSAVEAVDLPACRFWKMGNCKNGADCKFSHGAKDSLPSDCWAASTSTVEADNPTTTESWGKHRKTCSYWKAGNCKNGSDCRFSHGAEDTLASDCWGTSSSAARVVGPPGSLSQDEHQTVCRYWKADNCSQGDSCRYRHADDVPTDPKMAQGEATIGRLVQGSIVTFSAGLDVIGLTTGFELCTLRVKNISADVKEDDLRALMSQQQVDPNRFYPVDIKSVGGGKVEAEVVTDGELGWVLLAIFEDNGLEAEVSGFSTLQGMAASSAQDATVLTLSWPSPAVRYAVMCIDAAAAQTKVHELNGCTYNNRRVKAQMSNEPFSCTRIPLGPDAIIISDLPPETSDTKMMAFSGSSSVKRLERTPSLNVREVEDHLYDVISRIAPERVRSLDLSLMPDPSGFLSIRACFCSREDALAVQQDFEASEYGKDVGMWLRVPRPMDFTISLDPEQYSAQKTQWDALMSGIEDPKACMLNIHKQGHTVRIRLSGSEEDRLGTLKVKVEDLARGETVRGWHRTLAHPKDRFSKQVYVETGAYVRVDRRTQTIKVYGSAASIERARKRISEELDRLSSISDYTVTVPEPAIQSLLANGGGLAQLKETFGEDAVKFDTTSRRITITGREEAELALDSILHTATGSSQRPSTASQTKTACPICLDDISIPFYLGCGHAYCVICLRRFLLSALETSDFPLRCYGNDGHCGDPIAISTIQRFVPPASFNHLLDAAFTSYISRNPEQLKYCKTPGCIQIYRSTSSKASMPLRCPSCFSTICSSCGESHGRLRQCAEEEERQNDAWIAAQGGRIKNCPRCNILIEKWKGSNHMMCRCGAHICWRCMGVFTVGAIYKHMREAHRDYCDN